MKLQIFFDFGGNLNQTLLVVFGEDNLLDTGTVSGDDFFFDTADFESPSPECDLSGHGQIFPKRLAAEGRDDGRSDSKSGGRTVFGNCPLRNVDVNIRAIDYFRIQTELLGV